MISLKEALVRKGRSVDVDEVQKEEILDFIKTYYTLKESQSYGMSIDFDEKYINIHDGVVDISVGIAANAFYGKKITTSLTNGLFKFGRIDGDFICSCCKELKSLEGAPEEVRGNFNCRECEKLKTLEGGPQIVGKGYDCSDCDELISLKGMAKSVNGDIGCTNCGKLKDIDYIPSKFEGLLSLKDSIHADYNKFIGKIEIITPHNMWYKTDGKVYAPRIVRGKNYGWKLFRR